LDRPRGNRILNKNDFVGPMETFVGAVAHFPAAHGQALRIIICAYRPRRDNHRAHTIGGHARAESSSLFIHTRPERNCNPGLCAGHAEVVVNNSTIKIGTNRRCLHALFRYRNKQFIRSAAEKSAYTRVYVYVPTQCTSNEFKTRRLPGGVEKISFG